MIDVEIEVEIEVETTRLSDLVQCGVVLHSMGLCYVTLRGAGTTAVEFRQKDREALTAVLSCEVQVSAALIYYTVLYCTYNTVRYVQYCTMLYNAILCSKHHAIQCHTVQYCTIQYHTMQHDNISHNTIGCYTVQCNVVLRNTNT
jgi:hypothetical protein